MAELLDLPGRAWFSFDDESVLARATDDPIDFVDALPRPAAVDEFQRAGRGFLLAVKQAADRDRARGQLLLTGSTNYPADKGLSETLAGRAGRLLLWPLSAGERLGAQETFLALRKRHENRSPAARTPLVRARSFAPQGGIVPVAEVEPRLVQQHVVDQRGEVLRRRAHADTAEEG
ncbi:AAA family ATPase [Saccharothrix coeruleofusca]|uniref:AAA family ATPase n=1 Tax=Saccharothrix coeruleofusca TaxID=33919 RepID=UPI0016701E9B